MQLHRDADKFRAAGADLVIIGNGSPSFIEGFREQTGYEGPIYTDPSLEVYKAAQLKRGVTKTLNLRALGSTFRALRDGQRQGLTQGDAWQQGGVLIVAPTGDVLWHHASEHPGDRPPNDEVLAALRDAEREQPTGS